MKKTCDGISHNTDRRQLVFKQLKKFQGRRFGICNTQGILELYPKPKPLLRHRDVICLCCWTQSNQVDIARIDKIYQIYLIKKREKSQLLQFYSQTHAASFYLFLYEVSIEQLVCSKSHARYQRLIALPTLLIYLKVLGLLLPAFSFLCYRWTDLYTLVNYLPGP